MNSFRSAAIRLATAATIAATASVIFAEHRASAQTACPQFSAKYCVADKSGSRQTMQTNPCLAQQKGFHVVHIGACESGQ
jgi:hypothetical protein